MKLNDLRYTVADTRLVRGNDTKTKGGTRAVAVQSNDQSVLSSLVSLFTHVSTSSDDARLEHLSKAVASSDYRVSPELVSRKLLDFYSAN